MNLYIKNIIIFSFFFIVSCTTKDPECTLKCAFQNKFLIGSIAKSSQIQGDDYMILKILNENFNSITAENCMKSGIIQPNEGKFSFYESDIFVESGEENNMFIVGRSLVWHLHAPDWFFVDKNGNQVSRDVLIQRMKTHIQTIVGRYKGRINGWEVVTDAVLNDGMYRQSKFYEIIGEDYIKLAFQFAHEADPDAELYYCDNRMYLEPKLNTVVKIIKGLKAEAVKIDGVTLKSGFSLNEPSIEEVEKSIDTLASCGLKVIISELDMSVLPESKDTLNLTQNMNPYVDGLPDSVSKIWNQRMFDFYKLFIKHSDQISRVTTYGVTDGASWRNDWPITNRTDYPLLFDRKFQPKPVVDLILKEVKSVGY